MATEDKYLNIGGALINGRDRFILNFEKSG